MKRSAALAKVQAALTALPASVRIPNLITAELTALNEVTAAEVPDQVVTDLVSALQALVESQTAQADPAQEAAPAEAAAAAHLPQRKLTAATTVVKEAFPYGHPGAEGASFFSDMINARRGDSLAAQRVDKANSIWASIAGANEPVAQTDVTIPNVYQDALLVNLPDFPRDFADNIPSTAISSARPILVPVVDAVTADGGSGEVVAAHSEGTNPAQGEVDIDYDTYTPGVYSGMFDINREALDAGSPGMDAILMGFLRRSYNNVTDTAAYTAIAGYSGIDTGSSTTDASNTVEAQNMVSTILTEMANFKARAGYGANIIWMAPSEFVDVTSLNATDGRPLFPYVNPQNTSGQASQANYGDIYINGVRAINAVNAATTKVVVANTTALHRWESPLLNFRWEEVAGPAKVRFVAFGYCLTSVLDARGVSLITQA